MSDQSDHLWFLLLVLHITRLGLPAERSAGQLHKVCSQAVIEGWNFCLQLKLPQQPFPRQCCPNACHKQPRKLDVIPPAPTQDKHAR
eukprot:5205663-Amphidinium_carterae.1